MFLDSLPLKKKKKVKERKSKPSIFYVFILLFVQNVLKAASKAKYSIMKNKKNEATRK